MIDFFATDLNLSPLALGAIVISSISFVVMFGIASSMGGFQDLIKSTLDNDALNRENRKKIKWEILKGMQGNESLKEYFPRCLIRNI